MSRFIRRLPLPLALAAALAISVPATLMPTAAPAQAIAVSVTVAPPPLPIYAQPIIPGPGYVWTPGYWAWGPEGYFWIPGTWIMPPAIGLLWTPGYWAWRDGVYLWRAGYWGPTVGFYGGINYGFGYFGIGYRGGYWDHDRFFYNRAVNNFGGIRITNVYNQPVRNVAVTRASFNGGRGWISAQPTAAQEAAAHERHFDPTGVQLQHEHAAAGNREFLAAVNHGRPSIGATAHPASFAGAGVVHTRTAGSNGPAARQPTHATAAAPGTQNVTRGPQQQHQMQPHQVQQQAPLRQAATPHAGPSHPSHGPGPAPDGRQLQGPGGEPGGGEQRGGGDRGGGGGGGGGGGHGGGGHGGGR
jgi:hypothetical protein